LATAELSGANASASACVSGTSACVSGTSACVSGAGAGSRPRPSPCAACGKPGTVARLLGAGPGSCGAACGKPRALSRRCA
jgi:hypothetical protein